MNENELTNHSQNVVAGIQQRLAPKRLVEAKMANTSFCLDVAFDGNPLSPCFTSNQSLLCNWGAACFKHPCQIIVTMVTHRAQYSSAEIEQCKQPWRKTLT